MVQKTNFDGEFPVTLDAKGRILFPAALKKQVPARARNTFMLLRSTDKSLVMYAIHDWEILRDQVRKLSHFSPENLEALRFLFDGSTQVKIDGANRLTIPRTLQQYAGIKKDVMLRAFLNRIEIWDEKLFLQSRAKNIRGKQKQVQKVLGGMTFEW